MSTFIKHISHTFVITLIRVILALVISVIVTRTLGPEGKGIYSMAMLLTASLITFTHLGMNQAITYYAGSKKYSPKEIFGNNIFIISVLNLFVLLAGSGIILFLGEKLFSGVKPEYLFLALFLIPFTYFFDSIRQILLGLQKIVNYNNIELFRKIFFLGILIILFFGVFLNIRNLIVAEIFSYLLFGIIIFFLVKKATNGIALKPNRDYLKDALSYGSKAYFANILWFLHQKTNVFLINLFLNPIGVGLYITAFALAEIIQWLPLSAATVFFPKITSESDPKKSAEITAIVCRNILFISLISAIFIGFLSKWLIILLYSDKFLDSIKIFQILLPGNVALSGIFLLHSDLYARGKPMFNTYTIGISLLLNIILNIILIPPLGTTGAALSMSLSYLFMFGALVFTSSRLANNKIKDMLFIKKSDFLYYRNFIVSFIKKIRFEKDLK